MTSRVAPNLEVDAAPELHVRPTKLVIDEGSFRQIVIEHAPTVLRYARQRVGSELAEDVVSDTFADAWRRRERFNTGAGDNVEAWLIALATFVVARHRRAEQRWLKMCADSARQNTRHEFAADESVDADHRVDAHTDATAFAQALIDMPRRERDAFLLLALRSMRYEDIADTLGVPVGTIRSRINRARRRLVDAARQEESS